MVRKDLLFLIILLSLSLDGLGIWANTPQITKMLAIMLFTATFLVLTLWTQKWAKAIWAAGVLYLLLFPYELGIVLPALIALIIVFAVSKGKVKSSLAGVLPAIVLALAYLQLGISHLPMFWNIATTVITAITSKLSLAGPLNISLSGWVALLFSFGVILLNGKSLKQIAKNLAIAFGVHLITLNIIAWALVELPMIALQSLWLYPFAQWMVLSIFAGQVSEATHIERSSVFRKFAIPLACLFGICIMITALYSPQRITVDNPRVALVNSGVLVDFEAKLPVHEPFGFGGAGSPFSMVPKYLDTFGFEVDIVPSLEEVAWNDTDIVVLVNFNEELNPAAHEKVADFVRAGGALSIVGDHTDMQGIATRMNALTDGMGIMLNDDTADSILLHRRKLWTNALQFHDNLLTHGFRNHSDVQVWGGASLSLKPGAIPVVSGKYGFSDSADPLNLGFGGRLGNRRLEWGEKAGDVVLVAVSSYGKGRLLFFGDTSSFQTPGIASSWLFVNRLFWWLVSEDVVTHSATLKVASYLLGFLILMIMLLKSKASASSGALLISLVIAILVSHGINSALSHSYDLEILDRMNKDNVALINTSLGEQMDLAILSPNSAMGLAYNLMRCGFVPIFGCYRTIQPGMIFLAAPTRKITNAEAARLTGFVYNGGILFLVAGWETVPIANNLLKKFELSIQPVMLGPVPWRYPLLPETLAIQEPNFKEAWPIKILNPQTTVPFYTFEDYILTSITRKGEGRFVLISDHRFLVGENLEEERRGRPENIKFFRELILEAVRNGDY